MLLTTSAPEAPLVVLGVILAVGLGLLVPVAVTAVAYLLFGDRRVDTTTERAAYRQALPDPNEAARSAGSWG
jgi:hypothetical protein